MSEQPESVELRSWGGEVMRRDDAIEVPDPDEVHEGEIVDNDGTRCTLCGVLVDWLVGHTCRVSVRR